MVWGFVTAVVGCIIVVFSLERIIREIRKGGIPNMQDQSFSDTFYEALDRLERLREDLDSINETFYESVERLERRIERIERQGKEPTRHAEELGFYSPKKPSQSPPIFESESPDELPVEESPLNQGFQSEMEKLLESGKDIQSVAKELNRGVGEVELIERLIRSKRKQ